MSRRSPRPVNERLRRLLVMLPWLQEQGTVSTSAMAERFNLSVDELITDLTLASLCGVSQDPRDLIDLWVDENEVHFGIPKYFERPLRLTVPEAFALIASAQAARQLAGARGDDALSRAIVKVAAAVGPEKVDIAVDLEPPRHLSDLAGAAGSGRVLVIDYWNVETGETSPRTIVAVEVFNDRDHWYVRSVDVEIEAERIFRVDRIESVRGTSETRRYSLAPRGEWFQGASGAVTVVIAVDPSYAWVLENYPAVVASGGPEVSEVPDGWHVVSLVVTGERWIRRVLLRLGAHARVLRPSDWDGLGSETARRVLERYASSSSR